MDCFKEHEYRLNKTDDRLEKLEECQTDLKIKTEKIDESTKSAHYRLDNMEEQTKAILKLGIAVENMTTEIKEMVDSYKDHESRRTV